MSLLQQRPVNKSVGLAMMDRGMGKYCAEVIARRIHDIELAEESFFGNLGALRDYTSILNLRKAAERIARSVTEGKTIVFSTDSDSDGCASFSIIHRFFSEIGFIDNCVFLTPNRITEGYGINARIVEDAVVKYSADLIVTADNGIAAVDVAKYAKKIGVDLLITDHHIPDEELPPAYAIVNPAQAECGYKNGILCGASMIFLTLREVSKILKDCNFAGIENLDFMRLIQIVGFATVADCVPLVGVNRILVKESLRQMAINPYEPFRFFMEKKGVDPNLVNEQFFGFSIGPACNAQARLYDSENATSFLSSNDTVEIERLYDAITRVNEERKDVQHAILQEATIMARDILREDPDTSILVLSKKEWHHGVVGIVAARISEEFRRPCFVFGVDHTDDNVMKGSGRSGGSLSIHLKKLLDKLKVVLPDAILGAGGHSAAAGIAVRANAISVVEAMMDTIGRDMVDQFEKTPVFVDLKFDGEIPANYEGRITDWLSAAPFGNGFELPAVAVENARIHSGKCIGKTGTVYKFKIGDFDCIAFGMIDKLKDAQSPTLVLNPQFNHFRGRTTLQFNVAHIF